MAIEPEVQRRLLELVYGVLPDEEAAALGKQIEADPELAAARAEAQRTARALAEAARLEVPPIELQRPQYTVISPAETARLRTTARAQDRKAAPAKRPPRSPWSRVASWSVTAASLLLLASSLGGYFYHRGQLAEIAAEHLRLQVSGPAKLQSGVVNVYTVLTSSVTGRPITAGVEYALLAPDGKKLLVGSNEKTDEQGRLLVKIPADKIPASQASLQITALHQGKPETVDTRLAVEPVRYVTCVSLDRPLYRPGDTVYYRSVTLSRFGLAADRQVDVHFEILAPSGAVLPNSAAELKSTEGVAAGTYEIPEGLPGGAYSLVARSPGQLFDEQRREFFLRDYRLPRLKKQLEFTRDSFGPGDRVVADLSVEKAEGKAAAGAKLHVVATVDGKTVHDAAAQTSPSGTYQVQFDLPAEIEHGEGQLAVICDDGGTRETIAKTIPINLGRFDVTFYPEGGDLVPGLENRVYFAARDPLGKPVHIKGRVLDGDGEPVALVETAREGMGLFKLVPEAGAAYRLEVESPAVKGQPAAATADKSGAVKASAGKSSRPTFKLPEVSAEHKVVLTTGAGVFAPDKPLEFNVRTAEAGIPLVAAAWCRDVFVGQRALVSHEGANEVSVEVDADAAGVIRLTIFDYRASPPVPIAERLVYRRPARELRIRLTGAASDSKADRPIFAERKLGPSPRYAPGEHVGLSVLVTDEAGNPAPAVLGASVVDDTLLNLADDHSPRMRTALLLAPEVRKPEDLEKLDFYLSDDPKAPEALDLLLGTQGWRRFVEKTPPPASAAGAAKGPWSASAATAVETDPPAMFDNLASLEKSYRQKLEDYHSNRTRVLNTLTVLSLFGGAGLMLLVAMLSLLKITSGPWVWIPSVLATVTCLVIGAMLINPEGRRAMGQTAVAFASFDRAPQPLRFQPLALPPAELPAPAAKAEVEAGEASPAAAPVPGRPMDAAMFGARQRAGLAAAMPMGGGMGGKALRDERRNAAPAGDLDRFADAGFDRKQLADEVDQEGRFRDGARRRLMEKKGGFKANREAVYARQYAHVHRAGPPGVRTDFAETLFWHPMLLAGADGRAKIDFDLSDSVTSFLVRVDGHAEGGRLGSAEGRIVSRIPFSLEPKLPLEVTADDHIDLPLAVVNDSPQKLPVEVALEPGPLVKSDGEPTRRLELAAQSRTRTYFPLDVSGDRGECELTLRGTAGPLADAVRRPLRIVPPGFPKALSYGGRVEGDQEVNVALPNDWVKGSLQVTLNVFPSALADLQKGVDGMLREPNGCFEQASTANYPNVMALSYMQEHNLADPQITRRARDLLDKGYGKLAAYETPARKGYEWFGAEPGHEALSAYGLMEFRDMAAVYPVDAEMLRRTATWLLSRRDGKGGFLRNPKALDSFGAAPPEITDAYIAWALSEAGQQDIDAEIRHAGQLAEKSDDPYLVALAAGALLNAGNVKQAKPLLDKLAKAQAGDGHLEGSQGSITRSGGLSLRVETTALAALVWMKTSEHTTEVRRAIDFLLRSRQGAGDFGSTQATILALKALLEHSKLNRHATAAGKLTVKRNDAVLSQQDVAAGREETITVSGLEAKLQPGDNRLVIGLTGNNQMPYSLDVRYRSRTPQSNDACPLRLTAALASRNVKAGETVALAAEVSNSTSQGQPMTVAILGLPAGLEVRPDQLEQLKKAGTIDFYETRAREVICYWRSLAPKRKVSLHLDLIATIPGRYTGPASCVYLYYTAEEKQWAEGLTVEIGRD